MTARRPVATERWCQDLRELPWRHPPHRTIDIRGPAEQRRPGRDHPFRGMSSASDGSKLSGVSLLCQLVPRQSDGLVEIGIATSALVPLPDASIGSATVDRKGGMARAAEPLARILLSDGSADEEAIARLEAAVDERVDVWTPALHTTSRFELVSVLTNLDDALGDLRVTFSDTVESPSTVFLAWRATGRFLRPAFLDDDQLLEPSGAVVRLAGSISVGFTTGRRADRIRCYYDRLSLLTQMLAPTAVLGRA